MSEARARALLRRLVTPGFDERAVRGTEGFWEREASAISLSHAVQLVRARRSRAPGFSPRWYWEVDHLEELLLARIAEAWGLSTRQVNGILQREDRSLRVPRGPRRLAGHEYMGAFLVSGALTIGDPCYLYSERADLVCQTRATVGRWHVYVRCDDPADQAQALLVVHRDHLKAAEETGRWFGSFAVDSGRAAVFDRDSPDDSLDDEWSEDIQGDGILGKQGCVVATPYGDGGYSVRRARVERRAVMLRLNLTGDREHSRFGG